MDTVAKNRVPMRRNFRPQFTLKSWCGVQYQLNLRVHDLADFFILLHIIVLVFIFN